MSRMIEYLEIEIDVAWDERKKNLIPIQVSESGFEPNYFFFNLHSGGWNQGPLDTEAT
jgi:hypothetical protein